MLEMSPFRLKGIRPVAVKMRFRKWLFLACLRLGAVRHHMRPSMSVFDGRKNHSTNNQWCQQSSKTVSPEHISS
jgi:hypothetical protein